MNLNKGISTPIATLLIIAVSAVVGVAVWQLTKPAEQPTSDQASDYTTQSTCEEADYYWYDDACHKEKPLTVISPNGGEAWKAGETYEIKWSNNSSEIKGVYLELYQDDKYIETNLKTEAPTTIEGGTYEWTIPENLEEGDYKIKITGNTEEYTGVAEDFSDGTFKIKNKSPTEASLPEITSPNGGEKWKIGTNHDIEWDCPEDWMDNGNFSIYVANDSGSEKIIKSMATCSSERYTWKIGYNTEGKKVVSPGDNFKIRLRTVAGAGELHDESNNFSITQEQQKGQSVTITSPNGGEEWKAEEKKIIEWKSQNVNSAKTVDLLLDSSALCGPRVPAAAYSISSEENDDRSFEWNVGKSSTRIIPPGDYKLTTRIAEEICDASDNPFSITWDSYSNGDFQFEYLPSMTIQDESVSGENLGYVVGRIGEGEDNEVTLNVSRDDSIQCSDESSWITTECGAVCQEKEDEKVRQDITVDGYNAKHVSRYEQRNWPPEVKRDYICIESNPPVLIDLSVGDTQVDDYRGLLDGILENFQVVE